MGPSSSASGRSTTGRPLQAVGPGRTYRALLASSLLPLVAACAAAHCLTVLLLKRSILTLRIARRGHHLRREYSVDPFELVRVKEVMVQQVDTLPATMTALGH